MKRSIRLKRFSIAHLAQMAIVNPSAAARLLDQRTTTRALCALVLMQLCVIVVAGLLPTFVGIARLGTVSGAAFGSVAVTLLGLVTGNACGCCLLQQQPMRSRALSGAVFAIAFAVVGQWYFIFYADYAILLAEPFLCIAVFVALLIVAVELLVSVATKTLTDSIGRMVIAIETSIGYLAATILLASEALFIGVLSCCTIDAVRDVLSSSRVPQFSVWFFCGLIPLSVAILVVWLPFRTTIRLSQRPRISFAYFVLFAGLSVAFLAVAILLQLG